MTEVSTSVTAFVAPFENGPAEPVLVHSIEEASALGPPTSDGAFALLQFFVNGGSAAWVAPTLESLAHTPFNLLVMPELRNTADDGTLLSRIAVATQFCEARGAFFLLDAKAGIASTDALVQWITAPAMVTSASPNSALYWPDVVVGDPSGGGSRTIGPSSTIAGIYARTDAEKGVWIAPAGVTASMKNVLDLTAHLNDQDQGKLTPLAANTLRMFPTYGYVVWGARTRAGDNTRQSDWKYVPVRRLALYIEQGLAAALEFTAFQPNDPELWSRVMVVATQFMQQLMAQGAFAGSTPADSYFVRCTGSPLQVAFAAVHPAEFIPLDVPFSTAGAG